MIISARFFWLGLLTLVLPACATVTSMKTPRAMAPGEVELQTSVELNWNSTDEAGGQVVPELGVQTRVGVVEDLEVDAKLALLPLGPQLTIVGGEVAVKYQVLDDRGAWGVELAFAAAGGYRWNHSSGVDVHIPYVSLPVILGLNVHPDHQLIFSALGGVQWLLSDGVHPIDAGFFGGSFGYRWQITHLFSVQTEFTALFSPSGLEGTPGTWLFQSGLATGFHF